MRARTRARRWGHAPSRWPGRVRDDSARRWKGKHLPPQPVPARAHLARLLVAANGRVGVRLPIADGGLLIRSGHLVRALELQVALGCFFKGSAGVPPCAANEGHHGCLRAREWRACMRASHVAGSRWQRTAFRGLELVGRLLVQFLRILVLVAAKEAREHGLELGVRLFDDLMGLLLRLRHGPRRSVHGWRRRRRRHRHFVGSAAQRSWRLGKQLSCTEHTPKFGDCVWRDICCTSP